MAKIIDGGQGCEEANSLDGGNEVECWPRVWMKAKRLQGG